MSLLYAQPDPTAGLSRTDRARLRRCWIDSPAVWRFVPHRGSTTDIESWMAKQNPAEWHEIATQFNWDTTDFTPVLFIAKQPNADRASIMSMVLDLDLMYLEDKRLEQPDIEPRLMNPEVAHLMDLIVTGFKNGYYQKGTYRLSHDPSALLRLKTYLDTLGQSPIWSLPEQAWCIVEGRRHFPEFVWDYSGYCQRLPFDTWVRNKLRPN